MFEHLDEQPEKRELMRALARVMIRIDNGDVGTLTDERRIEKGRDGILKLLEMLKGKTPATPALASAEIRKICEYLGVRGFANSRGSAQAELATAESLLTGLRRVK
jgi:hypothetical protein